jgi:hypothetical protein
MTPQSARTGFNTIPNGIGLLVEPSDIFVAVRRQNEAAAAEYATLRRQWRKRLFLVQCAIALVLFLRWTAYHAIIGSAVMAFLAFLALGVLPLSAGMFSSEARRRMDEAQKKFAAERQAEVERNLAGVQCGRYRWIRRGSEYLAIFPEAGFLYHFGGASRDRHMIVDAGKAVKQVRVTTDSRVRHKTTGTTTHGRRLVVSPTPHLAVIGKGRSTTETTTETQVTTAHALEIQVQLGPDAQPGWIVLPFADAGHDAENWRLLVDQLAR